MPSFEGKTVLITGAAGGFGREMTRQLLQAGSLLILSDRSLSAVHAAAAEIAAMLGSRAVPGKVIGYAAADLASAEGCEELYRQTQAISPAIDVLINNAGIAMSGAFVDVPQPKWELLMQINLLAPMRLTAQFLPGMIARRTGMIINISSCAGLIGTAGLVPYSTSKFGLRGFGEALAHEVAPHGINVTNVYPFFARTPILNSERFGQTTPQALPDRIIEDPAAVVAELLAGAQAGRRHVYPGPTAKRIYTMQRLGPWAAQTIARLNRRKAAQERNAEAPASQPVGV